MELTPDFTIGYDKNAAFSSPVCLNSLKNITNATHLEKLAEWGAFLPALLKVLIWPIGLSAGRTEAGPTEGKPAERPFCFPPWGTGCGSSSPEGTPLLGRRVRPTEKLPRGKGGGKRDYPDAERLCSFRRSCPEIAQSGSWQPTEAAHPVPKTLQKQGGPRSSGSRREPFG